METNSQQILWWIGVYYFCSTAWIDVGSALTAFFTHKTFTEFGSHRSIARTLINDGVLLAACAWTLFLIGAVPAPLNPMSGSDRLVCILFGVFVKDVAQPMQAVGWWRFSRAMRENARSPSDIVIVSGAGSVSEG